MDINCCAVQAVEELGDTKNAAPAKSPALHSFSLFWLMAIC
jgi:hypothetical protein